MGGLLLLRNGSHSNKERETCSYDLRGDSARHSDGNEFDCNATYLLRSLSKPYQSYVQQEAMSHKGGGYLFVFSHGVEESPHARAPVRRLGLHDAFSKKRKKSCQ
jgi:hypothetical protein